MKRLDITDQNQGTIVLVAGLIALSVKLFLSVSTIGTNDVMSWAHFMTYIYQNDSVSIYGATSLYNHPPLVSGYLWVLGAVVGEDVDLFPFLIRLPAILADFGSLWLIWRLTSRYFADRRALWATLIFALSPTLILVSGFHGNSDPVFLFLVLASLYVSIVRRNVFLAGILFGLSISIKIVPLMLLPAFFFLTRGRENRLRFFGATTLMLVAGYGYHLTRAFQPMVENIFLYQGLPGIWGIPKLVDGYGGFGTFVLEIIIILMMAVLGWRMEAVDEGHGRDRKLLEAFSATFLAALVLSPGFGVQYLAWLVPAFCFVTPLAALVYSLSSGLFLLLVYRYWSGGFPLFYANSWEHPDWTDLGSGLGSALWMYLCVVLVVYSVRLYRVPGPESAET